MYSHVYSKFSNLNLKKFKKYFSIEKKNKGKKLPHNPNRRKEEKKNHKLMHQCMCELNMLM